LDLDPVEAYAAEQAVGEMGLGGGSGGGVALPEGVLEEFVIKQVVVCHRRHLEVDPLGIAQAVGRFSLVSKTISATSCPFSSNTSL